MASGDTLFTLNPRSMIDAVNPRAARTEQRVFLDSSLSPIIRTVIVFAEDSPVNAELIMEFMIPASYANTTGFTVNFFLAPEKPRTTGNVRMELAIELLRSNTATNLYDTSTVQTDPGGLWGTAAAATIDVATATAGVGGVKSGAVALVKANTGGGAAAAGSTFQMARVRLRRLNTDALDTLIGNLLLFGLQVNET